MNCDPVCKTYTYQLLQAISGTVTDFGFVTFCSLIAVKFNVSV